jgi:hypothetical protein
MKVEEVEGLKDLIESLQKKVNGQEELVQKFKTEAGEVRTFASEIKEVIGDKEIFKKTIDSLKGKSDNSNSSSSNNQGGSQGGVSSQVEDYGKKLTKEQREKADAIFKKLNPEDRIVIKSDPEKRNAFFKAAIDAAPSIPESLFDDESASTEEDKFGFKKLFGLGNKEKNFVPGSRSISANGFSGSDPAKPISESNAKRLIGGKIPRPAPHSNVKE